MKIINPLEFRHYTPKICLSHEWYTWHCFIDRWLAFQTHGLEYKYKALHWFLTEYLTKNIKFSNPENIFNGKVFLPNLMVEIEIKMPSKNKKNRESAIIEFLEWVVDQEYTKIDEHGNQISLYKVPFTKDSGKTLSFVNSNYQTLPFYYIECLRNKICPRETKFFSGWNYPKTDRINIKNSEWISIEPSKIDKKDADLVVVKDRGKTYAWNPSLLVLILIKLHLPLRTYQLRFLDSGAYDSLRFESGAWVKNPKSEKNSGEKGVFRRIETSTPGRYITGLYINTNKTSDSMSENEKGYTIPWENKEVLFWLEKLRNWQEKYNPTTSPTPCTELNHTIFGSRKSDIQKKEMGCIDFIFRNKVDSNGLGFPLSIKSIQLAWYNLLENFEDQLESLGEKHSNGEPVRFIPEEYRNSNPSSPTKTNFPLHSLRVSLLTSLAVEGEVPIEILSKALAGHSSILMTLYYIKPGTQKVTETLSNAERLINSKKIESLENFLKNCNLDTQSKRAVYTESPEVQHFLDNPNQTGWLRMDIGICLMHGNQTKNNDKDTCSGCWNGGIDGSPVPHKNRNCVRCRWFVTDITFARALVAHFNLLSYCGNLAARRANNHSKKLDIIKDERYRTLEENQPFTKKNELEVLQRRYESQVWQADQYTLDMAACITILRRIKEIENNRGNNDTSQKLIAVSDRESLELEFSLNEIDSELLHICQVCDDSEIYPDIRDEVYKLPAITKRTNLINRAISKGGYSPVFLELDEEMQLLAGNTFFRNIVDGSIESRNSSFLLQHSVGIIEASSDIKKISEIAHSIQSKIENGFSIKKYTKQKRYEIQKP